MREDISQWLFEELGKKFNALNAEIQPPSKYPIFWFPMTLYLWVVFAAYNGKTRVTVADISKIITLCLRHRLRKDPLESIDSGDKVLKVFKEIFEIED